MQTASIVLLVVVLVVNRVLKCPFVHGVTKTNRLQLHTFPIVFPYFYFTKKKKVYLSILSIVSAVHVEFSQFIVIVKL